jgi:hypothetical protein
MALYYPQDCQLKSPGWPMLDHCTSSLLGLIVKTSILLVFFVKTSILLVFSFKLPFSFSSSSKLPFSLSLLDRWNFHSPLVCRQTLPFSSSLSGNGSILVLSDLLFPYIHPLLDPTPPVSFLSHSSVVQSSSYFFLATR